MASFAHADLTVGRILYDNVLRDTGAIYAYSGAAVSGKTFENAYDWRDFSLFEVALSSITTFDITVLANTDIDSWSTFISEYTGTGNKSITLQYESSPAVFTTIATIASTDKYVTLDAFTPVTVLAGRKIRFSFDVGTAVMNVRQLVVGEKLDFDMGQWNGISPPRLNHGIVTTNNISINGSIIGRSSRRFQKKGNITLTNLTETWVRDTWDLFSIQATKHAFIYQWSPVDRPEEVSFTTGTIEAPSNSGPAGAMSVSMPIEYIVE